MGEPDIPVAKPWLDEREVAAVRGPVLAGWVTQGPEVAAFEREFAEYVGAPHACAVSNGTAALALALRAAGVRAEDEVITVSHSFVATANTIRAAGAIAVFVDVEAETLNLDPTRLEAAITPRTRAILCVHQLGLPCDLPAILAISRRHQLPVVEDAACAIGSEIRTGGRWERIGRPHGDVACFSFHPRKLLTTGEGGMVTTRHAAWDERFRRWRQHGMSVSDAARHQARTVVFETYDEVGFNYRLTDLQAAIGRVQLQRLPAVLVRRRAQVERYRRLLRAIPGLAVVREPEGTRSNWQSFAVRLPDGTDQRAVMQALLDRGIATRRGVMCAHREPAYAREPWRAAGPLAESERAQDRMIILPLFHEMSEREQERVVDALTAACRPPARVAKGARV